MEFPAQVVRLRKIIRDCTLCPRICHVNREAGELGACRIGAEAIVASSGPHFGEEGVLVGERGSGAIFFCGCNLDCVFCQNSDISQSRSGRTVSTRELADMVLDLQQRGCENINFVSPTHVSHAVAEAVVLARADGLTRPVVYNCGGFESTATLRLLDGLVDIYMPDFKWANTDAGKRLSGATNYPAMAVAALAEMFRQVGPLRQDSRGVASRGVLARHLVMPGDLACSRDALRNIAAVAPGCSVNVMGQYRPAYRAAEFPELQGRPSDEEVADLREFAASLGLVRVD